MNKIFLILLSLFFSGTMYAQCPVIKGVMIDACNSTGFEGDNEFIVLKNGTANLSPANITIYYGSFTPPSSGSGSQKTTFNHLTGTYTAAMNNFIAQLNATAATAGCSNLVATSIPPTGIPANATFFVFSPLVTQAYDFSSFCSLAPLYIVFDTYYNVANSCTNSGGTSVGAASGTTNVGFNRCGTFKNFGIPATNNNRYFSVQTNNAGGNCPAATVGYDFTLLPQQLNDTIYDGDYINWNGTVPTYTNNGCTAVIVPITLKNFAGVFNGNKTIDIKWVTATEINTSHTEIQRSSNGINFKNIHTEIAFGNSSTDKSYLFKDEIPENKPFFYRLKMVDFDGKFSYSKIILVDASKNKKGTLNVYPNPANDKVSVEWKSTATSSASLTIMDLTGRVYSTVNLKAVAGQNKQQLNTDFLPNGEYLIKIVTGENATTAGFCKL